MNQNVPETPTRPLLPAKLRVGPLFQIRPPFSVQRLPEIEYINHVTLVDPVRPGIEINWAEPAR